MDDKTTIRAFIAMPLCKAALDDIVQVQGRVKHKINELRFVEPRNIHLTLHFFGQVRPDVAMDVMERAGQRISGLSPFTVRIQGIGAFPGPGRARVLWLGIDRGSVEIRSVAGIIAEAVDAAGLQRDHRPFRPHLTIARAKKKPVDIRGADLDFVISPCTMDRVVLFQSRLTPRGPIYTVLKENRFGRI